ncbi:MAG: hypothetical protein JWR80_9548 [Bradyrhizobium sp.]|nr:hypothetical protein [Bradyrhizobium sp.]
MNITKAPQQIRPINGSSTQPLVIGEAAQLVAQRIALDEQLNAIVTRISELDQYLDSVASRLPAEIAAQLSQARAMFPTIGGISVSRAIYHLLRTADGGRSLSWLRGRLMEQAEQRPKILTSPSALYDPLSRLCHRGDVIKHDGFYYLAETFRRIACGELNDVLVERRPSPPFAYRMLAVFDAMGGCGDAGEIVAAARADESVSREIDERSNKVYRWLGHQIANGKLVKHGSRYRIAS